MMVEPKSIAVLLSRFVVPLVSSQRLSPISGVFVYVARRSVEERRRISLLRKHWIIGWTFANGKWLAHKVRLEERRRVSVRTSARREQKTGKNTKDNKKQTLSDSKELLTSLVSMVTDRNTPKVCLEAFRWKFTL